MSLALCVSEKAISLLVLFSQVKKVTFPLSSSGGATWAEGWTLWCSKLTDSYEGSSRRRLHWGGRNKSPKDWVPLRSSGQRWCALANLTLLLLRQEGWKRSETDTKAGISNGKGSVFLDFVDKKVCLRLCDPSFTQGHSWPMWKLCSLSYGCSFFFGAAAHWVLPTCQSRWMQSSHQGCPGTLYDEMYRDRVRDV